MDLYRIFKPVLCISRMFCLAPFTVFKDSGSSRYKFSTFWLTYSILGVCASFIYHVNAFWINESDATRSDTFSQVLAAATCLANVMTPAVCLKNGKNILRILDHVSVLDSKHSGARIKYYSLHKTFIFLLIHCIFSIVVPNIMSFAAFGINSVYMLKKVYYSIGYLICYVVLLLSDTQFIHFVFLLKYRFSVLNHSIINLTVPSLYKTSLNHTITAPPADRAVNSSTLGLSRSITQLKSTLRNVCRHHDSLCDISESVNETYSFQILLSVIITCVGYLHMAYTASIEFANPSTLQLYYSNPYFFIFGLVGLCAMSSKTVLLVAVCNRASREVSALH
jgi:hypothetical protein